MGRFVTCDHQSCISYREKPAITWLVCMLFNHKIVFRDTLKSAANDHKCSIVSKRSLFTCTCLSGSGCSSTSPGYGAIGANVVAIPLLSKWRTGCGAQLEHLISLQCADI